MEEKHATDLRKFSALTDRSKVMKMNMENSSFLPAQWL